MKDLGMENAMRFHLIETQWNSLMGGTLALHASPANLSGDQLLIFVDAPAWLQELSFRKAEIIRKLEAFGIRDVRFRVGRTRRPSPEPVSAPRTLTEAERTLITEILSPIEDAEVREQARLAMERWALRRHGRGPGASRGENSF
jgi:hypothetical protein